jgi:hypothetical protein
MPYLSSFWEVRSLPELPKGTSAAARSAIITAILWNIWKKRNNLISLTSTLLRCYDHRRYL